MPNLDLSVFHDAGLCYWENKSWKIILTLLTGMGLQNFGGGGGVNLRQARGSYTRVVSPPLLRWTPKSSPEVSGSRQLNVKLPSPILFETSIKHCVSFIILLNQNKFLAEIPSTEYVASEMGNFIHLTAPGCNPWLWCACVHYQDCMLLRCHTCWSHRVILLYQNQSSSHSFYIHSPG